MGVRVRCGRVVEKVAPYRTSIVGPVRAAGSRDQCAENICPDVLDTMALQRYCPRTLLGSLKRGRLASDQSRPDGV